MTCYLTCFSLCFSVPDTKTVISLSFLLFFPLHLPDISTHSFILNCFFIIIIISSVYFSCPDCSLEIANPICLLMEYACPLLVERLITWFYFYHFKVYCLFILSFIFPFLSLCAGLTRHCYSLQLLLLYS